jgi:HAMP domain-containing protein
MALIPSLLISYNIIGKITNELKDLRNGELNFSSRSITSRIESKINQNIETVNLVKNICEKPNLDSDQWVAYLVSTVEKIDNLLSVTVAVKTKNGYEEVVSSQKDFVKKGINQLISTTSALSKINFAEIITDESKPYYFKTPHFNRNLNTWISQLVMDAEIPHLGKSVIIAQIDFSEIADIISVDYLNNIGSVFLTDISGTKFLSSQLLTNFPDYIISEASNFLKSKNRVTLVNNYTTPSNHKYVTCFSYPQNVDWVVVAFMDEENAYSVVNKVFLSFMIFIGISGLLTIVTTFWFSKHLGKPIIKMANVSKTIADGNFDVALEYKAKDSIGLLGNSLTTMGSQLKKNFSEIEEQKRQLEDYSKNLEKKVEDRTAELNESNNELKKAYKRVLDLNEEKNEFLGIAAHDLKNPLTAVTAFAEILREDKELAPEQHDDFLSEIEKASNKMFFIVKNLLDVNAIEQGKLNTKMEQIQIPKIIKELLAQFQDSLSKKNMKII